MKCYQIVFLDLQCHPEHLHIDLPTTPQHKLPHSLSPFPRLFLPPIIPLHHGILLQPNQHRLLKHQQVLLLLLPLTTVLNQVENTVEIESGVLEDGGAVAELFEGEGVAEGYEGRGLEDGGGAALEGREVEGLVGGADLGEEFRGGLHMGDYKY